MHMTIDIPELELEQLDALSRAQEKDRTALVISAIQAYLRTQTADHTSTAKFASGASESLDAYFGIWADRKQEIYAMYEQLRSEWERKF